jgi:hypothetical protein
MELISWSTRNVADALREALGGPGEGVPRDAGKALEAPPLPEVTPPATECLRVLAAAARAFTETLVDLSVLQAYALIRTTRPSAATNWSRQRGCRAIGSAASHQPGDGGH